MTNLEYLCEGLKEIARNHGFKAGTSLENGDNLCIYGGSNIPTYADTRMLCEEVGIDKECLYESEYGIDIYPDDEWFEEDANYERMCS